MDARPGLATAIAMGDAATLDRIERLLLIERHSRAKHDAAPATRAEAAMRKHWPSWK